jgi:hypothetical protein
MKLPTGLHPKTRRREPRENSPVHLGLVRTEDRQLTIANLNARRPSVTLGMSAYDDRQWQRACLSEAVEAKTEAVLSKAAG